MNRPTTVLEELLGRLDEDLKETWEERAAIMEYDGGLPREHAECLALLNVYLRHPTALTGLRLFKLERDGEHLYLLATGVPEGFPSCTEIDDPATIINSVFGGSARLVAVRENDHLI